MALDRRTRVVRCDGMRTAPDESSTSGSTDDRRTILGHALGPALRETLEGRLGDIRWFRADWQRSGAATGRARWTGPTGEEVDVVVKLPVSEREYRWLGRLQDSTPPLPVPRLLASGDALGGYQLAWVVIEHLPVGPLGTHWEDDHILRMTEAAARFQAAAAGHPIDRPIRHEDWERLLKRSREAVRGQNINQPTRWRRILKSVARNLDAIVENWRDRAPIAWIHGDLHLANGMVRDAHGAGPVVLIDLAEVRPGHWVEDAVYLERLHWARPERLKGRSPVRLLATARRRLGLEVEEDHPRIADLRRILIAACAPAFLRTEGIPVYVDAALDQLERGLRRFA